MRLPSYIAALLFPTQTCPTRPEQATPRCPWCDELGGTEIRHGEPWHKSCIVDYTAEYNSYLDGHMIGMMPPSDR